MPQERRRKRTSGKKKSAYKRGSASRRRQRVKKQKMIIKGLMVAALSLVVTFLLFQLFLFVSIQKYTSDYAMDGLYVGKIHVGGLTRQQIEDELDKRILNSKEGTLTIKVTEDVVAEIDYNELAISIDAEGLAEEAFTYGKKGSLFERWRQIRECENNNYVIPTRYVVDRQAATEILEKRCASLYSGAVDAGLVYKKGKLTITEGKSGTVFDTKATIKEIEEYLNGDWNGENGVVDAKSKKAEPRVHAEDLNETKQLIGTFQTSLVDKESGSLHNIITGAKHLNGTIVLPGEEFSVNSGMEPYTLEAGYVEAGSYANGEVVQTMGGGICQVSTTVYNALLFAELEITERYPHSMTITYVDPAMDAAIADDIKDLKFVNNYDTAIMIECITTDEALIVNIYGKESRPSNRTIAFQNEIIEENVPEKPKFIATDDKVGYYETLSAKRIGYEAKLWKIIYEDGEEVEREQVNTSYYKSAKQVIGVGTNTSDSSLQRRLNSAIASQDEQKIKDVMYGRDIQEQESEEQQ